MDPGDFVVQTCHALLENIDTLVDEVAREIMREEPTYGAAGAVAAADLRNNNRENLRGVLAHLAGKPSTGTAFAVATGRLRAEQGVPLPIVLRAYRIGTRVVWDRMVVMTGGDSVAAQSLLSRASDIWRLVDDYSQALTSGYQESIAEQHRRDASARAAALEALLRGEVEGAERLRACADTIRIPIPGSYTVVCAAAESTAVEPIPGTAETLSTLGIRSAWQTRLHSGVGIVALTESFTIERLGGLLRERARDAVGISPVFGDLAHAHTALRKAELACAAADSGEREVLRYEQGLLGVLIASSPEVAHSLVEEVLGPIMALHEHDRTTLLTTLSAWFRWGGNITDLSERLFVHRNTVRFRLNRITELTGKNLSVPGEATELHFALRAANIVRQLTSWTATHN